MESRGETASWEPTGRLCSKNLPEAAVDLFDGVRGKCPLTSFPLGDELDAMAFSRPKLPPLTFEIFDHFGRENAPFSGQKILVSCSGGLDSVVLVDVFSRLAEKLNLVLGVAHVHHGRSKNSDVEAFRESALELTRSLAIEKRLPFFEIGVDFDEASPELLSEAELRKFRLSELEKIRRENGFDRVAFAHHADDLIETRVMRLIRGTGAHGLRAMSEIGSTSLRPFLFLPKSALREHARTQDLKWVEDVSNSDQKYFRNWVRENWLPLLESRKPGSVAALGRSLDLLTTASLQPVWEASTTMGRQEFHTLDPAEKQVQVARITRSLDAKDFGKSKVDEVLKRLARLEITKQKSIRFQVGGLLWKISPQSIHVAKI